MDEMLEHPEKASLPMSVTLLGMEIEVRLSQFLKADLPMVVTPSGMVYYLIAFPSLSIS